MTEVKTALLGYGSGGKIYNAPVISSVPGFKIKKILTSNPQNIEAAKNDFPEAAVVQDLSEVIQDKELNLVIILLPNHLHYKFAKAALEANKHVIVEKPFTTTVEEADNLIEIATDRNLVLTVNHNRRWDSDFRTVTKIVNSGKLGDIVEYESHFDRFRTKVKQGWKENPEIPGSGILYDLGSHIIDQALVLFGNPAEVFADVRIQRKDARVPDNFELILFYPNFLVRLKAGMLIKEKGPTYLIFGTNGSFLKYGVDVQEEALKRGLKPKDMADWGIEPDELWGSLDTVDEQKRIQSEPGDYTQLYQNLYNTITSGEEILVTPQQARDVIKIIELAQKSNLARCAVKFE